ncbi:apolipoprotein D-like [Convolutriloba macropyga]|uniref:apolipoprotein D-like n=1 Tax=Convolutriloba macropyga TaxID=536237 RepID=UPI003F52870C
MTMKTVHILSIITFLVCIPEGWSRLHLNACPKYSVLSTVNLTQLEGSWFEIERFNLFFEERFVKCNMIIFSNYTEKKGIDPYLHVTKMGKNGHRFNVITGKLIKLSDGQMIGAYKRTSDIFARVFSSDLILFEPEEYAVFYGCWPFGYEYLWIYSKRRYLTFETKAMLNNILTEMGIDMNGAMIIDQINCP